MFQKNSQKDQLDKQHSFLQIKQHVRILKLDNFEGFLKKRNLRTKQDKVYNGPRDILFNENQ